jgi:FG-GAP-like repeat
MQFNQPWKPDFNGDGKTDIFWRNNQTNQNGLWLMDGARISQASFAPNVAEEQGWQDVRFGDFNGDGKTDFLWRNTISGDIGIWLMDGGQIQQAAVVARVSPDWVPEVTDFNGDGKTDLFWQNQSTGQTSFWIFDGTRLADSGFLPTIPLGWKPSVGDFNGDGKGDIFWRNNITGQNSVWTFNGRQLTAAQFVRSANVGWNPTIGDFDGDGRGDILWNNPTIGDNQVWFWSKTALKPEDTAVGLPGTSPRPSASNSFSGNLFNQVNLFKEYSADTGFALLNVGSNQSLFYSDPKGNRYIDIDFNDRTPIVVPTIITGSNFSRVTQWGDFNGDGIDDVLATPGSLLSDSSKITVQGDRNSILVGIRSRVIVPIEVLRIDPNLGWRAIL